MVGQTFKKPISQVALAVFVLAGISWLGCTPSAHEYFPEGVPSVDPEPLAAPEEKEINDGQLGQTLLRFGKSNHSPMALICAVKMIASAPGEPQTIEELDELLDEALSWNPQLSEVAETVREGLDEKQRGGKPMKWRIGSDLFSEGSLAQFVGEYGDKKADLVAQVASLVVYETLSADQGLSDEDFFERVERLQKEVPPGGALDNVLSQLQESTRAIETGTAVRFDWPTFLGPTGDGKSPETQLGQGWNAEVTPSINWMQDIGEGFGACSISGNRLYLFDRKEGRLSLSCYELDEEGQLTTLGEPWPQTYQTSFPDVGGFLGPRCQPVVDGDNVYLYDEIGNLYCVSASTGEKLWHVDTAKDFRVIPNSFGVASTPVVEGDLLLVVVGGSDPRYSDYPPERQWEVKGNGSAVVAFDKRTGDMVYQLGDYRAGYASIKLATIAGVRWGFAFLREGLLGFDPVGGEEICFYPFSQSSGGTNSDHCSSSSIHAVNAATPVVFDDRVLISSGSGRGSTLLRVRQDRFEPIAWANPKAMEAFFCTPIYDKGYLYGCSGRTSAEADLRCVDWNTGEIQWSAKVDFDLHLGRFSILHADGQLIGVTESGQLFFAKATPDKTLASPVEVPLRSPVSMPAGFLPARLVAACRTAPVLANGHLFIRGSRPRSRGQRLASLDISAAALKRAADARTERAPSKMAVQPPPAEAVSISKQTQTEQVIHSSPEDANDTTQVPTTKAAPKSTEPKSTEPKTTEPKTTEPKTTEPKTTESKEVESGSQKILTPQDVATDSSETGDAAGLTAVDQTARTKPLLSSMESVKATGESSDSASEDGKSRRYALLVGCTNYPHLKPQYHLEGPGNDVELMRQLLVNRFKFDSDNIQMLTDSAGPNRLPTRENIQKAWQKLASQAARGDQVFVLMAGHGSQVPQQDTSEEDPEPDGLDEVFLPRDVGEWDHDSGRVENAISDDDIRHWVEAIDKKGAMLCVLIDACHSGTMTRSAGDERRRELPGGQLGVPKPDAIKNSIKHPAQAKQTAPYMVSGSNVVAFYASQSTEPTIEKKLPRRGSDRKYFGLLTYTINQVLTRNKSSMTYRELLEQVHRQYVSWGRTSPTPMLEGSGLDREFLGYKKFPSQATVKISKDAKNNTWTINAGSLLGLTPGSILSVHAQGTSNRTESIESATLGYVKVLGAGLSPTQCQIATCEHDGKQPPQLIADMRCKIHYIDYGDQRLRISIDPVEEGGQAVSDSQLQQMQNAITHLTEKYGHLLAQVDHRADVESDWMLRFVSNDLFLVPHSGWPVSAGDNLPPLFGPAPNEPAELNDWLKNSLKKIARVQILLGLAEERGGEESALAVAVRRNPADPKLSQTTVKTGTTLHDGDSISIYVNNNSSKAKDVTVLLIDNGFGIHTLFPNGGETNRLYPGNQIVKSGRIKAKTTGLWHAVVMSVDSANLSSPSSFDYLSQETIQRTRSTTNEKRSHLEQLLESSLLGVGKTRGASKKQMEKFEIQIMSWNTVPQ